MVTHGKNRTRAKKGRPADETLCVASEGIKQAAFDYYPRLGKVKEFVVSRLSEPISLQAVAKVASYETTYFCALFHRRVGLPFSEWLKIVRMTKATELMQSRDYSIWEVAHAVGYSSLRTFERAFKSVLLSSPRQYKNTVRPS